MSAPSLISRLAQPRLPVVASVCLVILVAAGLWTVHASRTTGQALGPASTAANCTSLSITLDISSLDPLPAGQSPLTVDSISWGADNPISFSGGGISSPGVAKAEDAVIARPLDAQTLQLFEDVADGAHLGTVTAHFVGTDATGQPLICEAVAFYNAVVATKDAHVGNASDSGPPTDTLTLAYSAVAVSVGSSGADWDYITHTGGVPTASRVATITAVRHGTRITVRWSVPDDAGILGFNVLAGHHRLNHSLIAVHRAASYTFAAKAGLHARLAVQTVLRGGERINTPTH